MDATLTGESLGCYADSYCVVQWTLTVTALGYACGTGHGSPVGTYSVCTTGAPAATATASKSYAMKDQLEWVSEVVEACISTVLGDACQRHSVSYPIPGTQAGGGATPPDVDLVDLACLSIGVMALPFDRPFELAWKAIEGVPVDPMACGVLS